MPLVKKRVRGQSHQRIKAFPARERRRQRRRNNMAGEWNLAEFKVEDLLQMAVIIEQKGYDFYSAVIEKSPERRVKNEIRFLREEEARHKVLCQDMLKKKGKSASGKVSAALDVLLRREFTDPLEELISSKKIESNEEALKFGIAMEQKIVDFYAALKDMPGAAPLAAELAIVSAEDLAHVSKLNAMLSY
jgi:rubrerythrin